MRARGGTQLAECLPSVYQALDSIPRSTYAGLSVECRLSAFRRRQEDEKFKIMFSLSPCSAMGDCLGEKNKCDVVEVSSTGLSHLISLLWYNVSFLLLGQCT